MRDGETDKNRYLRLSWESDERPNWDAVEANWLKQIALSRVKEDEDMQREYGEEATALHAELVEAIAQHTRLTEALLQARVLVDEKHADLDWLDDQFEKRKQSVAEKRAADDLRVQTWIINARAANCEISRTPYQDTAEASKIGGCLERTIQDSNAETEDSILSQAASTRDKGSQFGTSPANEPPAASSDRWEAIDAAPLDHISTQGLRSEPAGVEVINPNGAIVGILKRLTAGNHWIQKLLELPIRRSVEIRMGRKLTQDHLDDIHESTEPKKTKWLSFMIQATGEIQGRACQTCAKGQGLYSLCIIVGGSDFPRCGNCEWNKQGCHGAAAQSSGSGRRPKQPALDSQLSDHQHGSQTNAQTPDSPEHLEDRRLPTERNAARANVDTEEYLRRSRAKDKRPITPSRTAMPERKISVPPVLEVKEITKDNLVLKDDGMIFLEPEIMRGVPIRKISPEHAYWEPDWKRVEVPIRTKLDEWVDKLAALKNMPEHLQTEKDRTSVFQAGRQVNRGRSSLKFLQRGDFHPFQIVGKQWVTPSLVHYDTIFRMVATLEELAKFKMDVTPLQWLRQRLHEIYTDRPKDFKLDRVVAKMYHDPKLANLRSKNGFGNIGRPSTSKHPAGEKRKEAPTVASTPIKRVHADPGDQSNKGPKKQARQRRHGQVQQKQRRSSSSSPSLEVFTLQNPSKSRNPQTHGKSPSGNLPDTTSAVSGFTIPGDVGSQTLEDDLDCSGYTSTDSLTRDPVVKKDWRVHQVKTMRLTSNPSTTQYWHWVDKCHDCEPMFEHQVLKEMEPATSWGIFKEPIDFHLRLRELTNIAYSRDSQKVVIGTRRVEGVEWRDNVLAHFKRERTKRRFLTFMRKKGVDLVRTQGYTSQFAHYFLRRHLLTSDFLFFAAILSRAYGTACNLR